MKSNNAASIILEKLYFLLLKICCNLFVFFQYDHFKHR